MKMYLATEDAQFAFGGANVKLPDQKMTTCPIKKAAATKGLIPLRRLYYTSEANKHLTTTLLMTN
jgi:hypothetical protein